MRDHFALMIFAMAAMLLFTDWQLASMPKMRTFFRWSVFAIWIAAITVVGLAPNVFTFIIPGGLQ